MRILSLSFFVLLLYLGLCEEQPQKTTDELKIRLQKEIMMEWDIQANHQTLESSIKEAKTKVEDITKLINEYEVEKFNREHQHRQQLTSLVEKFKSDMKLLEEEYTKVCQ